MISANLTNTLKNIIQSAGLYESGRLYNSIVIDVTVNNRININIQCMNYFVYLNQKYRLTTQLQDSPAMAIELEMIYSEIINGMLEESVKGKATSDELPLPVFLINGV